MDSFSGEGCRAPRPDTGHGGGSTYGRTLTEFETFHKRDHKLREGKKILNLLKTFSSGVISLRPSQPGVSPLSAPGARFSKLQVITGPVKLFCFPFQKGVSKLLKIIQ